MRMPALILLSLIILAGCAPAEKAADFIKVEVIEGVAHLRNVSTDRLIKATYSCGGYTSQSVILKPGESAISDLGNAQCSKATVTSAKFVESGT
jgi:hypothetical protein